MPRCCGLPNTQCPFKATGKCVQFRYAELDLCPCCELERRSIDGANVPEILIIEATQFSNKMKSKSSKLATSIQSMGFNPADNSEDETSLKSLQSSSVRDPINSTNTNVETKCNTIFDPLLSYVVFSLQNCTIDSIRKSVIDFFSQDAVIHSKNRLWNACDTSVIGEKMVRTDSSVRTQKEAHIDDILKAFQKLDKCNKTPHIALDALSLSEIPKFSPEELNSLSMVDRQNRFDTRLNNLQEALDFVIAENLILKETFEEIKRSIKPSYAQIFAREIPQTAGQMISHAGTPDISKQGNPKSSGAQPTEKQAVKQPLGHKTADRRESTQAIPFLSYKELKDTVQDGDGCSTTSSDPFELPKQQRQCIQRRERRNNIVKRMAQHVRVKGAGEPSRNLFIYRVNPDTQTDDLKAFISDNGFSVVKLECISNPAAKYKSCKLEVPSHQFKDLFNEELWPTGIYVRKFFNPSRNKAAGIVHQTSDQ